MRTERAPDIVHIERQVVGDLVISQALSRELTNQLGEFVRGSAGPRRFAVLWARDHAATSRAVDWPFFREAARSAIHASISASSHPLARSESLKRRGNLPSFSIR